MKGTKIMEAIKILKVNKVISASQTAFCEAADIAIDAMEKQIPMKVKEVHVDEYYCPACGVENCCNDGAVEDKFCPECGQKLKY